MTENELIDWIQLINSNNIGPVTFYKMLDEYGSAAEALKVLAKRQTLFGRSRAEDELRQAERRRIRLLVRGAKGYPQRLSILNDAPPILYAKGRTELLDYPVIVAMVGARNASVNGRKIISKMAYDLTQSEVLVISGMARGVDAAAHRGALYARQQTGATVAVLGTGVDVPYPLENKDIYEKICAQGVVISEYPLGTPAQTNNFPRRNRIVSALSDGIIVGESSLNSGSLITARLGLEQGREIFAVPGSPLEGRSAGANRLIKEGAVLVESAEDVLEVLKMTRNRQIKAYSAPDLFETHLDKPQKNEDILKQNSPNEVSPVRADRIPTDGIEIDEFIRQSALTPTDAMIRITELELDGQIERRGSRLFVHKQ